MSLFVLLKLVHVLPAITAVGANLTYPFWLRRAASNQERVLVTILGVAIYAPAIRRLRTAAERDITSPEYVALDRRQTQLGLLATAIAIVTLIVTKPTLG